MHSLKAHTLHTAFGLVLLLTVSTVAAQEVAPDFSYVTREGVETSLYEQLAAAPEDVLTVLLFYNSDCLECLADIDEAAQMEGLPGRIKEGIIRVIAIDPYGDRELWQQKLNHIPELWSAGFDTSDLLDRDLYDYSVPPACFFIDSEKNILHTCTLQEFLHP